MTEGQETAMTDHTPAPWRINGGRIEAGGDYGTDSFEQIAIVGFVNAQSPANTANARLIASAPDLLDALIDMDNLLMHVINKAGLISLPPASLFRILKAREGIDKATGVDSRTETG